MRGPGSRPRQRRWRRSRPISLERGVELFNLGLYWEAHEAWEEVWITDRDGPEGGFYKGLIQVAAGYLHSGRRNRRGALNKWRSGAGLLRPYPPRHLGVDLTALLERVDLDASGLAASEAWVPPKDRPRIEYAPGPADQG